MATTKSAKSPSKKYESNPFVLTFNSFANLFKTNLGWGIGLVALAVFGFIWQMIGNLIQLIVTDTSQSNVTTQSSITTSTAASSDVNVLAVVMVALGALILLVLFIAACIAIGTFITGVLSYVALESEKGKSVSFGEAIEATGKRFWRLYLAQILAGLKIFGWTLLLIIPGIFAAFRYALLPFVVMAASEDEQGARASHTQVKSLVKGRLIEVFGVAVVAGIIPFVGSIMRLTGNASLYQQLKAYEGKDKPKPHWLNYLGFMLIGLGVLLVLFVLLIVGLVALAS